MGDYAYVVDGAKGLKIMEIAQWQGMKLGVRRLGPQIQLFWGIEVEGFKLQRAQSPETPNPLQWRDAPDIANVAGHEYRITLEPAANTFYRLIKR